MSHVEEKWREFLTAAQHEVEERVGKDADSQTISRATVEVLRDADVPAGAWIPIAKEILQDVEAGRAIMARPVTREFLREAIELLLRD